MNELINNKRVVIVGPAPYLNEMKIGKLIDNYDIIIRFNKGHNLIKNPDIFGSRTDILYHCVCQKKENGGKITNEIYNNVKLIYFCYPILKKQDNSTFINGNIHQFKYINKFKNKSQIINKNYYLNLEKEIGCRPNTGIISILDILDNYNPKELYITGFTFFKDGYSNLYRNTIDGKKITEKNSNKHVLQRMMKANYKGRHNQWLIFNYFRKRIKNYINKIKLDNILLEMFKFNLEEYKNKNNLHNKNNEQVFCHYLLN